MRLHGAIMAFAMGSAFAVSAAQAQTIEQVEGTIVYASRDLGSTKVAQDMVLARISQEGKIASTQATSAINGSTQTCIGTVLVKANALLSGEGICDTVDAQGDVWWLRWSAGPKVSLWTIVGGTGKYAGAKGAGTTSYVIDNMQTLQASGLRQRFQGVMILEK